MRPTGTQLGRKGGYGQTDEHSSRASKVLLAKIIYESRLKIFTSKTQFSYFFPHKQPVLKKNNTSLYNFSINYGKKKKVKSKISRYELHIFKSFRLSTLYSSPAKCHNAIYTLPTSTASTGKDEWANGIRDTASASVYQNGLTLKLTSFRGKKNQPFNHYSFEKQHLAKDKPSLQVRKSAAEVCCN